jgi:hypothetical protein
LANQRIKAHVTSKQELDDLRAVVERDLTDAAIAAVSADRRFATAYNAALQTATMAIACSGYRSSGIGHHQTTFEAAELALGTAGAPLLAYFDTCRRKRNTVDYDRAHVATETEANEVLQRAKTFRQLTEAWILQNYPALQKT